jgi:hypothetical protein
VISGQKGTLPPATRVPSYLIGEKDVRARARPSYVGTRKLPAPDGVHPSSLGRSRTLVAPTCGGVHAEDKRGSPRENRPRFMHQ